MKILPYEEKFRNDVENICIETGPVSAKTDRKIREYILSMYCRYYIEQEPQNALVVADDDEIRAYGYIICAEDFKTYYSRMKPYFAKIRKTGIVGNIGAFGETLGTAVFAKKYPAHMHIDLTESIRSQGFGSKMIETLCTGLAAKGVKGIMLIVGSYNDGAVRFYERNGFRKKLSAFGGIVMVRKLND